MSNPFQQAIDEAASVDRSINDDDYYIVHPDKKHIVSKVYSKVPYGQDANVALKSYIDSADKRHGAGHKAMKGMHLKHEVGYTRLSETTEYADVISRSVLGSYSTNVDEAEQEKEVSEAEVTTVKDKEGKVVSFKYVGDWKKSKGGGTTVDKSGAKHTPYSKVRDKARAAIKRVSERDDLEEATKQVVKDASGKVVSFKYVGDWKKTTGTGTTVDKSGAKHTPYSKVRDKARAAIKKVSESEVDQLDETPETAADIDKKIEFHRQGQAAAQYKGAMNKMHAAKIRELVAKKQALKQGAAIKKVSESEVDEGSVPDTEREKDLAAAAHPKDKITHKDVLVKRGVLKAEGVEIEEGHVAESEQIDELSKSTLASYTKKAADSATQNGYHAGGESERYASEPISKRPDSYGVARKKAIKRLRGINKAVARLTKEDVEQQHAEQPDSEVSVASESMVVREVGGRKFVSAEAAIRLAREIAAKRKEGEKPTHNDLIAAKKKLVGEETIDESFEVVDAEGKVVHVAYSEGEAKKHADKKQLSTGKKHTVRFKREASVPTK